MSLAMNFAFGLAHEVLARAICALEMSFARTWAPVERRREVMGMPGPQPSSRILGCDFDDGAVRRTLRAYRSRGEGWEETQLRYQGARWL